MPTTVCIPLKLSKASGLAAERGSSTCHTTFLEVQNGMWKCSDRCSAADTAQLWSSARPSTGGTAVGRQTFHFLIFTFGASVPSSGDTARAYSSLHSPSAAAVLQLREEEKVEERRGGRQEKKRI